MFQILQSEMKKVTLLFQVKSWKKKLFIDLQNSTITVSWPSYPLKLKRLNFYQYIIKCEKRAFAN